METERLSIRRLRAEDWERIKNIWDDFGRSPFSQYDAPHKTDAAEIREQIKNLALESRGERNIYFSVCLERAVIGYVEFHQTGDGMELGYCFHSDFFGKGYAKESCQTLIRYFQKKGVRRFTAGTALKNLPSVGLLHALGFRKIGEEQVSFYQDENGNDIVFDGGIFELNV